MEQVIKIMQIIGEDFNTKILTEDEIESKLKQLEREDDNKQ